MDISIGKKFWHNFVFVSAGVKNLFDNTEIGGDGAGVSSGHGSGGGASSLVGYGRTFFVSMKFNFVKY